MTVSCWNSTMVWCFPELVKVATADNEALKVFLWENYQWASRTGRAIRWGMRRWGGGISGKRSYPHNRRQIFSKWTLTRHRMWDIFTSVKKFSLKEPNEMLCPAVMVMVAFSLCVLALCRSSAVNIFNAFTDKWWSLMHYIPRKQTGFHSRLSEIGKQSNYPALQWFSGCPFMWAAIDCVHFPTWTSGVNLEINHHGRDSTLIICRLMPYSLEIIIKQSFWGYRTYHLCLKQHQ